MAEKEGSDAPGSTPIGQIPLRRVSRSDVGSRPAGDPSSNPMNRLVPYLDLFSRLTDAELARLSGVPPETTGQLRKQVDAVGHALARYVDLLPRLADAELMRLTGASAKTIRFWRLCQPRATAVEPAIPDSAGVPAAVREADTAPSSTDVTGKYSVPAHTDRFATVRSSSSSPTPVPPTPVGARGPSSTAPSSATSDRTRERAPLPAPARRMATGMPPAGASSQAAVQRAGAPIARGAEDSRPSRVPSAGSADVAGATSGASARADSSSSSPSADLGLSGAPFPGYEYDPNEAAALDKDEDGIFLGLELPDPSAV